MNRMLGYNVEAVASEFAYGTERAFAWCNNASSTNFLLETFAFPVVIPNQKGKDASDTVNKQHPTVAISTCGTWLAVVVPSMTPTRQQQPGNDDHSVGPHTIARIFIRNDATGELIELPAVSLPRQLLAGSQLKNSRNNVLRFSPDSKLLLYAANTLSSASRQLYEIRLVANNYTSSNSSSNDNSWRSAARQADFTPDGKFIVIHASKKIHVLEVPSPSQFTDTATAKVPLVTAKVVAAVASPLTSASSLLRCCLASTTADSKVLLLMTIVEANREARIMCYELRINESNDVALSIKPEFGGNNNNNNIVMREITPEVAPVVSDDARLIFAVILNDLIGVWNVDSMSPIAAAAASVASRSTTATARGSGEVLVAPIATIPVCRGRGQICHLNLLSSASATAANRCVIAAACTDCSVRIIECDINNTTSVASLRVACRVVHDPFSARAIISSEAAVLPGVASCFGANARLFCTVTMNDAKIWRNPLHEQRYRARRCVLLAREKSNNELLRRALNIFSIARQISLFVSFEELQLF